MDRRNFIKIAGVAAAVGVTGCTGNGGDGGDGGDGNGDGDNGDGNGDDGNGGADTTVGQDGNLDADLTGEDEVEVDVGAGPQGFKFDPADIRIDAGTTVRWVWTGRGSQHNVIESDGEQPLDDPSFESELVADEGHEFTHTFEEPGTYDYVCEVHLAQDMIGSVEVVEGEGGGGNGDGMDGNETESDGMDGNEST